MTTDASRRAAVAAVSGLTESLIDTVNGGVADVFEEQKQIDGEARALRAKSQKFAQVTGEWVRIVEGFDERLRGIGDFETWIKKIEFEDKPNAAPTGFGRGQTSEARKTALKGKFKVAGKAMMCIGEYSIRRAVAKDMVAKGKVCAV